MPKDIEWNRRLSVAMRLSAETRKCPECGRHGAVVEVVTVTHRGELCRWARDYGDRLCSWPGVLIKRTI